MPRIKITDAGGASMTVMEVNGLYHPGEDEDTLKGIPDITIRDDDIMIYAFKKCGTHWLWEIVRLLVAGNIDGDDCDKDEVMLEFFGEEALSRVASPRILNTHVSAKELPKGLLERKNKFIYIVRNPKDAAVSSYHHHKKIAKYGYDGEWKNFLSLFLEGKVDSGSWFKHIIDWDGFRKSHPEIPVLMLTYEDLKEYPMAGIKKLNQFLGVNRSEEFMHQVKDATSFDKMKATKGHVFKAKDGSSVMYRKGEVGDWKNYFTVAQNEMFDKLYKEKMAGCDINVRFTL